METSFLFSQQQLLPGRKVQLVKCMPYVGFNEKYLVDVDSASLSLVFVAFLCVCCCNGNPQTLPLVLFAFLSLSLFTHKRDDRPFNNILKCFPFSIGELQR